MPLVSDSTVRGASNAGPVASTVTPGSTPPDVSFTVPVMDAPCAHARRGTRHSNASNASLPARTLIRSSLALLQLVTITADVNEALRTVKDRYDQNATLPMRRSTKLDLYDYLAAEGFPNRAASTATLVFTSLSFAV